MYMYLPLSPTFQPVCVMSTQGAGRTGCVCAVVCAYQMMTDPSPEPECWEREQNILDQVQPTICPVLISKESKVTYYIFALYVI